MRELIEKSFFEAEDMLRHFMSNQRTLDCMEAAANLIIGAFNEGAKVLTCGNGGSMCDAMHFAEEWSGRFRSDRQPYAAIALSDPAHMSCVANDYGFEHVFSRQVRALGRKGDVLILLSTSGNSPNILRAAEAPKASGVTVIGFLGRGGGQVRELCDVIVPGPADLNQRGERFIPDSRAQRWFGQPVLLCWPAKPALGFFGDVVRPRLPSVLASLGTLTVVGRFCRRRCGDATAQLAGLILAGS